MGANPIRARIRTHLFDRLFAESEQQVRDGKAEGISGIQVDDQLELGRLTGKSAGLAPLGSRQKLAAHRQFSRKWVP